MKANEIRTRIALFGPEALTNSELLELILHRGKRNVSSSQLAKTIAADDGTYRYLARCHRMLRLKNDMM